MSMGFHTSDQIRDSSRSFVEEPSLGRHGVMMAVASVCGRPKQLKQTWSCETFAQKSSIWGWVKTLVPSEPQNSWDLWMFIPLKMVLIGIDPYPYDLKKGHHLWNLPVLGWFRSTAWRSSGGRKRGIGAFEGLGIHQALQGFRMDHLHQRFHGHKLLLHVALVLQMAPNVLTPLGFWTGKMGKLFSISRFWKCVSIFSFPHSWGSLDFEVQFLARGRTLHAREDVRIDAR